MSRQGSYKDCAMLFEYHRPQEGFATAQDEFNYLQNLFNTLSWEQLTSVNFSNCNLNHPLLFEQLLSGLKKATHLKQFILNKYGCAQLNTQQWVRLFSLFTQHAALTEITLCRKKTHEKNDEALICALENMLKKNIHLRSLTLDYWTFSAEEIKRIAKLFPSLPHLHIVSLQGNHFGDQGVINLVESIAKTKTISSLYLMNNDIGPEGLAALCQSGLLANLHILDLRDNPRCFADNKNGVADFFAAVANNKTMSTLFLHQNHIPKFHVFHLIELVKSKPGMTFYWGYEALTKDAFSLFFKELCSLLSADLPISFLSLPDCGLTDTMIHKLCKKLRTHSHLKKLDLHRNTHITDQSVTAFASLLIANKNLMTINLTDCKLSEKNCEIIQQQLKENNSAPAVARIELSHFHDQFEQLSLEHKEPSQQNENFFTQKSTEETTMQRNHKDNPIHQLQKDIQKLKESIECLEKKLSNSDDLFYENMLLNGAKKGIYKQVEHAVELNAAVTALDAHQRTALHLSVLHQHLDIARFIYTKAPELLEAKDDLEQTPLHKAATTGNLEMIRFLFDNNADIAAKDINQQTPFDLATPEAKTLLANKILRKAAKEGNLELVKDAMEHKKADINDDNEEGDTALHKAIYNNHADIVTYLISKDADVHKKNNKGKTPIELASNPTIKQIVANRLLITAARQAVQSTDANEDLSAIHKAIELGADINLAKTNQGLSVLHLAAQTSHLSLLKFFVERGGNLKLEDEQGHAPLHYAVNNAMGLYALETEADKQTDLMKQAIKTLKYLLNQHVLAGMESKDKILEEVTKFARRHVNCDIYADFIREEFGAYRVKHKFKQKSSVEALSSSPLALFKGPLDQAIQQGFTPPVTRKNFFNIA